MPDIQKIKLPDGTSYDIMDANAIHDPSEKSADNYLKYNGTEWTAASIPTTSHTLEGTELVIETDLGRDTSEFLKVTGGTMTGNLDMGENTLKMGGTSLVGSDYNVKSDKVVIAPTMAALDSSGNVAYLSPTGLTFDNEDIYFKSNGVSFQGPLNIVNGPTQQARFYFGDGTPVEMISDNGFYEMIEFWDTSSIISRIGFMSGHGMTMEYGNIDMNNNKITNVPTPTSNTDVVNKEYVDDACRKVTDSITYYITTFTFQSIRNNCWKYSGTGIIGYPVQLLSATFLEASDSDVFIPYNYKSTLDASRGTYGFDFYVYSLNNTNPSGKKVVMTLTAKRESGTVVVQ